MFYALSSIGSFTDGARKREREIRNERTAIREEFERWKANNPYATAMDFHAKVKQLGSTSPGGNVALPDSASIQRMAAENLRRKQEEEAEKERRRRIQDMDMKIKETTYARQLLMDNPNMSASQLLNSMGMPTTGATLEWAEGLQQKMKTELEQAQADRARKLEQEERVLRVQRQTYVDNALANDKLLTRAEAEATADTLFGPLGSSYSSPATSYSSPPVTSPRPTTSQTYGPTQPAAVSTAPSQAPMSGNDQGRVSHIQGVFDEELAAATSPEEARAIIGTISQRAMGQRGYTEDQIKTALSQSQVYADKTSEFRTMAFDAQLEEAQDISQLTAVVKHKKPNKIRSQDVPLKTMLESAFNNTNFVQNAYIPKGMETEVAKKLATYFELNDAGEPVLRQDIANMDSGRRVEMIKADLAPYGVAPKDEIQANRAEGIRMAPAINSVQDYVDLLAGDGDFSYPIDQTLADITANYETKAEKDALKQQLLNRLDAEIATFASGDSVAIYGAGFVDLRDLLPPGADADMAPLEQWFRDTRQKILDFDTTAGTITDGEGQQVEEDARLRDRALQIMQSDFGDKQVEAVLELVVPTERRMASIETDAEGNIQYDRRGQLPDSPLVNELTSSNKARQTGVAKAVASAVEVFNSFRDMPVSEAGMANKQGLGGIAMGAAQSVNRNFSQALAPFPQYDAALGSASAQFKATIQLIPGLDEKEITKLTEDFKAWLLQSTRNFFNAGSTGPYAKLNQPSRFEDFTLPSGLPDGARLYQAN